VSRRKPEAAASTTPAGEAKAPVVEKVKEAVSVKETEAAALVQEVEQPPVHDTEDTERYCVYCGQRIGSSFKFCPQCGQGAQVMRQCAKCGLDYIPAEEMPSYCPSCGEKQ
jgi:predicted RNA-binding Zn-ribbon protein involved in translation (DUF1610 family)